MTRGMWILLAASGTAVAVTPLERSELRHVVTLDYLMESCTVVGETAYGMIPHFDCESFLYGVEHPLMPGRPVVAIFDGTRLRIEDRSRPPEYPDIRVLADGELTWHAASRRWILAHAPDDATAPEVGGCSDGPETVDLALREYQTC